MSRVWPRILREVQAEKAGLDIRLRQAPHCTKPTGPFSEEAPAVWIKGFSPQGVISYALCPGRKIPASRITRPLPEILRQGEPLR